MSLVKCPECGKEISDSAKMCPSCGYPIKICPECKKIVYKNADKCDNCGYPFNESHTKTEANENTNKPNKFPTYMAISVISFIVFVICWYYGISHGVKNATAEYYYAAVGYVGMDLIWARICSILKPISLISGIVFAALVYIVRRN